MLEVARPSVNAAVRRDAEVEKIIKELIRAVGNGANTSNAGSKVRSVEEAEIIVMSISRTDSNALLVSLEQVNQSFSSKIHSIV